MPSSYTPNNRLVKQATGENTNVWGAILNDGAFELIDFALDGVVNITDSGATTLTTANGSVDQARGRILNYTGVSAGTLTIPSLSKVYVVRAATANCIITNGTSSTTIVAGSVVMVMTNGATVWQVAATDFANKRLTSVGAPTQNTDAATKKYVDDTAFSSSTTFPGQTGNSGLFITTNGIFPSWASPYPDQTGQAGEFLTTNGTAPSWEQIVQLTLANLNTVLATGRIKFNAFYEKAATYTSGAIDTSTGSVFTGAISTNTTISLSNLPSSPATGDCVTVNGELVITGSPTITWPAGITWFAPFILSAGTWMLTIKARWSGSAWVYVGTMVKSV